MAESSLSSWLCVALFLPSSLPPLSLCYCPSHAPPWLINSISPSHRTEPLASARARAFLFSIHDDFISHITVRRFLLPNPPLPLPLFPFQRKREVPISNILLYHCLLCPRLGCYWKVQGGGAGTSEERFSAVRYCIWMDGVGGKSSWMGDDFLVQERKREIPGY